MLKVSSQRINSAGGLSTRNPTSICPNTDAIPGLATLGVVYTMDQVYICHHAIFAVLPICAAFTNLFPFLFVKIRRVSERTPKVIFVV